MEQHDNNYDYRRLSMWCLWAFYGVALSALVLMVAANRSPTYSPLVETMVHPSCVTPEVVNCGQPIYTINAPLVITAFFIGAAILLLLIRPWQMHNFRTSRQQRASDESYATGQNHASQ